MASKCGCARLPHPAPQGRLLLCTGFPVLGGRRHICPESSDHPASGTCSGPRRLSTCGDRASGSSGQISRAAGPCLMSVAPGVRLSPACLGPLGLRHASPAPGRGRARGGLLLSSLRAEPGSALAQVKRISDEGLLGPRKPAHGPTGSGGHSEIQLSGQWGLQPAPPPFSDRPPWAFMFAFGHGHKGEWQEPLGGCWRGPLLAEQWGTLSGF